MAIARRAARQRTGPRGVVALAAVDAGSRPGRGLYAVVAEDIGALCCRPRRRPAGSGRTFIAVAAIEGDIHATAQVRPGNLNGTGVIHP